MSGETTMNANVHTYPMGTVIVREGPDAPREMVVVLQGNVGVYRNFGLNTQRQLRVVGKGGFCGELSLFLNADQEHSLVALTEVVAMRVNRRGLKGFLAGQPELATHIVEGICGRLRDVTARLERLEGAGDEQRASGQSSLFPEGHGSYALPLQHDAETLYLAKTSCPMCGHHFEQLAVIKSKLRLERTDPDMRMRYRDIEPLYYEITTCPNCFWSAQADRFEEPSPRLAGRIHQKVGPFKLELQVRVGRERDSFAVFAGYYLALLCAPEAFDNHHLVTAGLWLRLSRLYDDLGERELYLHASRRALDDYRYAYEHLNIAGKQLHQVIYLIGELYLRCGELDIAREFFFMIKTDKASAKLIRRQADLRLDELKERKQAEKEREAADA